MLMLLLHMISIINFLLNKSYLISEISQPYTEG